MPAVPDQVEAFVRAWEARDLEAWRGDGKRFKDFARQALALGLPALAYDICSEAGRHFPADRELRYLAALALANGGSSGHASRMLRDLLENGGADPEVLSLAGWLALLIGCVE